MWTIPVLWVVTPHLKCIPSGLTQQFLFVSLSRLRFSSATWKHREMLLSRCPSSCTVSSTPAAARGKKSLPICQKFIQWEAMGRELFFFVVWLSLISTFSMILRWSVCGRHFLLSEQTRRGLGEQACMFCCICERMEDCGFYQPLSSNPEHPNLVVLFSKQLFYKFQISVSKAEVVGAFVGLHCAYGVGFSSS